ncbi:hypothetical protein BRADI_2g58733v3 [Brachypodium distachyon]|uniref:Uncharacterized protein n=1 Tax=Brachypodium distachyon TaxID=15368 RepID=A0A2K2DGQ2_BRADI|nr:hypothetical protein BRADI_2g58733v3 [Brachypodium distachyon]
MNPDTIAKATTARTLKKPAILQARSRLCPASPWSRRLGVNRDDPSTSQAAPRRPGRTCARNWTGNDYTERFFVFSDSSRRSFSSTPTHCFFFYCRSVYNFSMGYIWMVPIAKHMT